MGSLSVRLISVWSGRFVSFMVRYGSLWYGMVSHGMVWFVMVRYGSVWIGMGWFGMVWIGMVWYGSVWYGSKKKGLMLYSGELLYYLINSRLNNFCMKIHMIV